MLKEQRSFLLGLVSYIVIFSFLLITHFYYQDLSGRLSQFWFVFLCFSLCWILLAFLREKNDSYYIKNSILIIEIYLILLMLIKPGLNFTHWEFIIRYLSAVWIFLSIFDYDQTARIVKIIISSIVFIFMSSLQFLMIYSVAPNEEEFVKQQSPIVYFLTTNSNNNEYFEIKLTSKYDKKLWNTKENFSTILRLNEESIISYYQSNDSWNKLEDQNLLIIQDQKGNFYRIFPQSQIAIYPHWNNITLTNQIWKYSTMNINTNENSLLSLSTDYIKKKNDFFIKKLPYLFQSNKKLQKLSYHYTKLIAKILPFYQENSKIADSYYSLFFVNNSWNILQTIKQKNPDLIYHFTQNQILWKTQLFSFFNSKFLNFFKRFSQ